jgi:hypothetical protein
VLTFIFSESVRDTDFESIETKSGTGEPSLSAAFFLDLRMPITISKTSLDQALVDCANAVESQSWATAACKYAVAEIIFSGLEIELQNEGATMKYRSNLESIKKAIDAAKAAAQDDDTGGIGVMYVAPPENM